MDSATHVVLRYRDGRAEKAILGAIDAEEQTVSATFDDGRNDVAAFTELKAIFFPHTNEDEPLEEPVGSTISVEFADGETIRGTAVYNPERNGFFLFPLDRSKNERIFVVNSAIVSIEVEKL